MNGTLAILGPGVLGRSAAQWAAECGLACRLLGRDQDHAAQGVREVHRRWERAVGRGTLSPEDMHQAMEKLGAGHFDPAGLADATALLEALPEDPAVKAPALASAARWGHADLLLLSGTSALSISDLDRRAGLGGRLIGFHLFVPVPRMQVVEMAVPPDAPEPRVAKARALGEALRKRVVQVRDQPGFAAARMALAQGLEAMRLLESGVASAEDLDALMTLGYGHPIGPLALSDRVGLDLRLLIAERLAAAGETRFAPPAILKERVARGETGMKAGAGFHLHPSKGPQA